MFKTKNLRQVFLRTINFKLDTFWNRDIPEFERTFIPSCRRHFELQNIKTFDLFRHGVPVLTGNRVSSAILLINRATCYILGYQKYSFSNRAIKESSTGAERHQELSCVDSKYIYSYYLCKEQVNAKSTNDPLNRQTRVDQRFCFNLVRYWFM